MAVICIATEWRERMTLPILFKKKTRKIRVFKEKRQVAVKADQLKHRETTKSVRTTAPVLRLWLLTSGMTSK